MPELSTLGYTIDENGNLTVNAGGGVGASGKQITVHGGDSDTGDGGNAIYRGGSAAGAGNAGGATLKGGNAAGGVAGESRVSGGNGTDGSDGGNVVIEGGAASGGGSKGQVTLDGRLLNLMLTAGGQIIITNLPTADPGTPGALYRTAGSIMISI